MKTTLNEIQALSAAQRQRTALALDSQIRKLNSSLKGELKDGFLKQSFCKKTLAAHLDCIQQVEPNTQWIENALSGKAHVMDMYESLGQAIYSISNHQPVENSYGLDRLSYGLNIEAMWEKSIYSATFSLLDIDCSSFGFCYVNAPDGLQNKPKWMSFLVTSTFSEFIQQTSHLAQCDYHYSPGGVSEVLASYHRDEDEVLEELAVLLKRTKKKSYALAWEIVQLISNQFDSDHFFYSFPTIQYECSKKEFYSQNSKDDIDIFLDEIRFRALEPSEFSNPLVLSQDFYSGKSQEHKLKIALGQIEGHVEIKSAYDKFIGHAQTINALVKQSNYLTFLQNRDFQAASLVRESVENTWSDCDLINASALHFVLLSHTKENNCEAKVVDANAYLDRVVSQSGLDIGNCRPSCVHMPVSEDIYSDEECYTPIQIPTRVGKGVTEEQMTRAVYEFYSEREVFKAIVHAHQAMSKSLQEFYDLLGDYPNK